MNDFDPNTTAVIYYVGAKDMAEDPRFGALGGVKKDGTLRYFREYDKGEDLKGWGSHGYIAVAPHVSIDIPEIGEMSGTNLRKALENADEETFEKIMGFYDAQVYDIIKGKLAESGLKEAQYNLGIFRRMMGEILEEEAMFGSFQAGLSNPPYVGTRRVSGYEEEEVEDEEELEEISAMGAGAVSGTSAPRRKKVEEDEIVNEFYNYLLNNLRDET